MLLTRPAVQKIGETRIEVDLDQNGYGKQGDDGRLPQDLQTLEGEEQNKRGKQRQQGNGLETLEQALKRGLAS